MNKDSFASSPTAKVYKVLGRIKKQLFSTSALHRDEWANPYAVRYIKNKLTVAKHGKLFTFSTVHAALDFKDFLIDMNDQPETSMVIAECDGYNPIPAYHIGCIAHDFSNIPQFWQNPKLFAHTSSTFEVCRHIPSGTVFCDAVKVLKFIK